MTASAAVAVVAVIILGQCAPRSWAGSTSTDVSSSIEAPFQTLTQRLVQYYSRLLVMPLATSRASKASTTTTTTPTMRRTRHGRRPSGQRQARQRQTTRVDDKVLSRQAEQTTTPRDYDYGDYPEVTTTAPTEQPSMPTLPSPPDVPSTTVIVPPDLPGPPMTTTTEVALPPDEPPPPEEGPSPSEPPAPQSTPPPPPPTEPPAPPPTESPTLPSPQPSEPPQTPPPPPPPSAEPPPPSPPPSAEPPPTPPPPPPPPPPTSVCVPQPEMKKTVIYVPRPVIRYGYFPRPPPPRRPPPVVVVNSQTPAIDCASPAPPLAPQRAVILPTATSGRSSGGSSRSAPSSTPGVIVLNTQGELQVFQIGPGGRTSRPPVVKLPRGGR